MMRTLLFLFLPCCLAAQPFDIFLKTSAPLSGTFCLYRVGTQDSLYCTTFSGTEFQKTIDLPLPSRSQSISPLIFEWKVPGLGVASGLMGNIPTVFSLQIQENRLKVTIAEAPETSNTWFFSLLDRMNALMAGPARDSLAEPVITEVLLADTVAAHREVVALLALQLIATDWLHTPHRVEKIRRQWCGYPQAGPWVQECCRLIEARQNTQPLDWSALMLEDAEGRQIALHSLPLKKYVLLDFWASWCGPCLMAVPEVKALQERQTAQLSVISISIDANAASWRKSNQKLALPWPSLLDYREIHQKLENTLHIAAIPAYVLLDEQRKIVYKGNSLAEVEALLVH
jgi:thiol-disulfide isomerase/thioredoxin